MRAGRPVQVATMSTFGYLHQPASRYFLNFLIKRVEYFFADFLYINFNLASSNEDIFHKKKQTIRCFSSVDYPKHNSCHVNN